LFEKHVTPISKNSMTLRSVRLQPDQQIASASYRVSLNLKRSPANPPLFEFAVQDICQPGSR
jgi:hypothetical protein